MSYKLYRRDGGSRWHAYFIDRQGERQRFSTKQTDRRRATIVADEWYRRLADPAYSAANATTLQVAAGNLIAHLKRLKRSKATVEDFYPKKLSHLARVWGADMPLARIEAKLVDDYLSMRETEGAKPYTISKELTALSMMLKVARRRGEFDKELSQVMPVGYATGYKPRQRRLTMEEARAFIAALPPGVQRYVAFVLCTTARDAAVGRARGRHITPDGIEVYDLKTKGSARTVPRVTFLEEFAAIAFRDVTDGAPVAPGLGSVRHAFDRAAKRLGLAHVSPNDLRRSVAHWMLERGIPRDAAAAFMGHANTKMLDAVYGKLDARELGASIARALGSSVEGSWKTGAVSADSEDSEDGEPAEKPCAGTESNRRHGDFQSTTSLQEQAEKQHIEPGDVDDSWKESGHPGLPTTPAGQYALVELLASPMLDESGAIVAGPLLSAAQALALLNIPRAAHAAGGAATHCMSGRAGHRGLKQASAEIRRRTPPLFAEWLIELAASARKSRAA